MLVMGALQAVIDHNRPGLRLIVLLTGYVISFAALARWERAFAPSVHQPGWSRSAITAVLTLIGCAITATVRLGTMGATEAAFLGAAGIGSAAWFFLARR
jgi:hypothetical protein